MTVFDDDEISASRKKKSDGTIDAGPVTAPATVVYAVLNLLNPSALSSQQAIWLTQMLNLSAPP